MCRRELARLEGFEPPTYGSVGASGSRPKQAKTLYFQRFHRVSARLQGHAVPRKRLQKSKEFPQSGADARKMRGRIDDRRSAGAPVAALAQFGTDPLAKAWRKRSASSEV